MNEKRKQSKDMPRVKPRHFRCLIPYLFVKTLYIYIFFSWISRFCLNKGVNVQIDRWGWSEKDDRKNYLEQNENWNKTFSWKKKIEK